MGVCARGDPSLRRGHVTGRKEARDCTEPSLGAKDASFSANLQAGSFLEKGLSTKCKHSTACSALCCQHSSKSVQAITSDAGASAKRTAHQNRACGAHRARKVHKHRITSTTPSPHSLLTALPAHPRQWTTSCASQRAVMCRLSAERHMLNANNMQDTRTYRAARTNAPLLPAGLCAQLLCSCMGPLRSREYVCSCCKAQVNSCAHAPVTPHHARVLHTRMPGSPHLAGKTHWGCCGIAASDSAACMGSPGPDEDTVCTLHNCSSHSHPSSPRPG